jgi:SOS-response transcriptional repressor LexA
MPEDHQAHEALRFIRDHIQQHSFPPSRIQVANHLGLSSKSRGSEIVGRLRDQGLVETFPGNVQGMRITDAGMKALVEEL